MGEKGKLNFAIDEHLLTPDGEVFKVVKAAAEHWPTPEGSPLSGLHVNFEAYHVKPEVAAKLFKPPVRVPKIEHVCLWGPKTKVVWDDGVETVCTCEPSDTYNPETGVILCMLKRMCGNSYGGLREAIGEAFAKAAIQVV